MRYHIEVMNMDNPTEVLTIQKPELPDQQSLFNESPETLWNISFGNHGRYP